jgi:transcriptional regulator with XRE-family HTH domain
MTIAEQIRAAMDAQQFRPVDLASRARCSVASIYNVLRGDSITLDTLQALADALQTTLMIQPKVTP